MKQIKLRKVAFATEHLEQQAVSNYKPKHQTMRTPKSKSLLGIAACGLALFTAAQIASAQTSTSLEIVFSSDRTGNREIWKMKADGSSPWRMTTSTVDSFCPFPSTDSKRIAYLRDTSGGREVHVMNADGSGDTLIRSFADGVTKSVTLTGWLPDDSKLLFSQYGAAGCTAQIWSLALDGTAPTLFLDPTAIGKREAYTLDFSSDGKRAIWTAQNGCWSPSFEIFSANYTNGAIDLTSVR